MAPRAAPMDIDPVALERVAERLRIRLLVLFGSLASGDPPPGPESDVDIAVSFHPSKEERPAYWKTWEALSALVPSHPLDLVYLGDTDPLFRWEILREGMLLWGSPLDHLEYRAFAFRDFIDSADLRRLERRLFEKRMAYLRRKLDAAD